MDYSHHLSWASVQHSLETPPYHCVELINSHPKQRPNALLERMENLQQCRKVDVIRAGKPQTF